MKALTTTGLTELITKIKAWGNSTFLNKTNIETVSEISIDSAPINGSNNLVKSGGVYTAISAKYTKPATGIPASDIESGVIPSLTPYRTAAAQDTIDNGKEVSTNKVTSLSASSTDTQYPSAKCVYDLVGNVEAALAALR